MQNAISSHRGFEASMIPVGQVGISRVLQQSMPGSNAERKRQGLRADQEETGVEGYVPGPPPGAGIGPGATPESSGLSPLQPIEVSPVPSQEIQDTLQVLRGQYVISPDDAGHLQWLMQTGLIRSVDARAVCQSMNLTSQARAAAGPLPRLAETSSQTSPPGPPEPALSSQALQLIPSLVPQRHEAPASWREETAYFEIATQPDDVQARDEEPFQSPPPRAVGPEAQSPNAIEDVRPATTSSMSPILEQRPPGLSHGSGATSQIHGAKAKPPDEMPRHPPALPTSQAPPPPAEVSQR